MKGVEPSGPRALSSLGSAADRFHEAWQVAVAQHLHHGDGLGIQRRQFGFVGERVRPFRALVDPGLDGLDLFGAERAGRRHLHSVRVARDPVKQEAVLTAAGHYAAAVDDRALAVEPQAAVLLRRSMTADAILPQDRQHILGEIDCGGRLSGSESREYDRAQQEPNALESSHNHHPKNWEPCGRRAQTRFPGTLRCLRNSAAPAPARISGNTLTAFRVKPF